MTCKLKRPVFPVIFFTLPLTLVLYLLAQSLAFAQADNPAEAPDVARENWVSLDRLSPQQLLLVPDACCGLYVEPELPEAVSQDSLLIMAGRGQFDGTNRQSVISGGIDVRFQNIWLQADAGLVDELRSIVELSGNIRLRQSGLSVGAVSARVDREADLIDLQNTTYVLHELAARGSAESILFTNADGTLNIRNGTYTVCEPGDNNWLLEGENIELNQASGRGTGRNVILRVKDVPVFYTPYISFPISDERTSGFLYPGLGNTGEGGFEVSAPYYFNLAPNYDATLTPRLMSERGVMLSLEARHLGADSSNTLDMSYLPNDSLYDPSIVGLPGTESPPQAKRWQLTYLADAEFSDNWSASADFSAISDIDYFQDFGNNGLSDTTRSYLYREGQLNYHRGGLQLEGALQSYQLIDPALTELNKPYSSLPRIRLGYRASAPGGMTYALDSEYVAFDRKLNEALLNQAQIDNGILVRGQRLALEPRLGWRRQTAASFINPEIAYKYALYNLDHQALGTDDSPDRGVMTAKLDSGLIFERNMELADTGYRQTLEPRLFYLYSDYQDQNDIPLFDTSTLSTGFNQLFREDRFSGRDRIADANQLTLALSSRLLDDAGREKARISLGQIQYFEDRRVGLTSLALPADDSSSAVAAELALQLSENWRMRAFQEWDPDQNLSKAGSFQFSYQSDINHILNFSYRYRNSPNLPGLIKQTDISVIWPVSQNLGLIGRWNYDLENKRDLETIIGFEYSNCCWDMRLIARQWTDNSDLTGTSLRNNTGIFLQFELKGLGNVLGSGIDTLIGESITGFRTYVENF